MSTRLASTILPITLLPFALGVLGCAVPEDEELELPWAHPKDDAYVQVLFGAHLLDEDEVDEGVPGDIAATIESFPVVGFMGQQVLAGEITQIGLEGGFHAGVWTGDVDVVAFSGGGSGGRVIVDVDSWLFTLDLSGGLFGGLQLWHVVRLYAGVGPSLILGILNADDDDLEEAGTDLDGDEVALALGAYARVGIEIPMSDRSSIGFSFRAVRNELEFDPLEVDLDGVQAALVFTGAF